MADSPATTEQREAPPLRRLRHGYPPPALRPGTETTAYCGVRMVVEGRYTNEPPADACPLCVVVWQERHPGR